MASSRWPILAVAVLVLTPALVARAAPGASAPPRAIVFSAHPDGTIAPAQLFRVQTTGDGLQQITTGRRAATAPAFSPDGRQLAFVRLGSGIFRVNLDGTGLVRLTSGRRDSYPVWSANGKRIAFIRPYRGDWRVYVMSPSGGQQRRLPQAPPAGRPSWTRNGKSIFVPSAGDLVKIDSRSGRLQKFYGLTLDIVTSQTATVSPGARMLAYVGPRISTGPPDCGEGPCPQFGLYLARVTAPHRPRRIANDTGPAGWSPDASTLVFVSKGALEFLVIGSGNVSTIASGPHIPTGDAPPAWQPR
jgi:hypothetical protein